MLQQNKKYENKSSRFTKVEYLDMTLQLKLNYACTAYYINSGCFFFVVVLK